MKKRLYLVAGLLSFCSSLVQADAIDSKTIRVLDLILNESASDSKERTFKQSIDQNLVSSLTESLDAKKDVRVFGQKLKWQRLDSFSEGKSAGLSVFRFGISSQRFTSGKLKLEGLNKPSVYLNGIKQSGGASVDLKLMTGDYRLLVIAENIEDWSKVSFEWESEQSEGEPSNSGIAFNDDSQQKRVSPEQLYDSEVISKLDLSPNGDWLILSKRHYTHATKDKAQNVTEIVDAGNLKVKYRWQAMSPGNTSWRQDSKKIAYNHGKSIYILDIDSMQIDKVSEGLEGIRGIDWYDQNTLIMSLHKSEKKPHEFTKRYRALEDRWSYWRGNTQVYLLDVNSGFVKQVTDNKLSSNLQDFDSKKQRLLISRSPINYEQPAHYLTQLYEVDLTNNQEKLLGEFRTLNAAAYSNSGVVFSAGPDLLGGKGRNTETPANNYDGQLYLLDKENNVQALSKNFKPAIGSFEVLANGDVLFTATDQDRRRLFRWNHRSKKFSSIKSSLEVVERFSASRESKASFVMSGTSATAPQRLVAGKIGRSKTKELLDTADESYSNSKLGELRDWDFTTSKGNQIDGRVYLPVDFDESKKYPAIIYYYGGTSPVSRAFTGRWPFNLWAAQGYVVYVLQPSGTTGYGQAVSSKHVNAWGLETADDIMESTQAFVKAHPFVDGDRLGNMGASYGGFMTMYLATKTDMFRASISHAGISNLTSYWGHGWWGYAYSGVATKGSFPWNKPDFYTEQSPVFHADKVKTPLLLIHGDADTNVPVGESHQMYTALKLLGKDVELIEFQGDDHHVNAREHRLRWWYTILSYLDKELKDQPEWWDHLYPEAK